MAFFRGAVAPFMRMTPQLLKFYDRIERWGIRARCPSGVAIEFNSDASKIAFSYKFGAAAREVFTTDIEVAGKTYTFDGCGPHHLELPAGKKDIKIQLPHLVVIEKFDFAVDDAAEVVPVEDTQSKLLLCGDSIMQGMTCTSPGKAWAAMAAAELGMTLHNTSVGGAVMDSSAVVESLRLVKAGDVAMVGFGTNDAAQEINEKIFREHTVKSLTALAKFADNGGKAFIVAPIPTLDSFEERRLLYSQMIMEEHKNFPQVTLIKGDSFYPADAEFFADKVHPNDAGMKVYAQAVIKAIRGK